MLVRGLVWILLLLPVAWAGDDANGLWRTQPSDEGSYVTVQIGPCAENAKTYCGVITELVKTGSVDTEAEIIGKHILDGMKPHAKRAGTWSKGRVWAPDDNKTYKAKMAIVDDGLKVSGCVFGGLICRSQIWTRVN